MKSFRIFFTVLTLLVLSQSTLAQYEYIFKTPFPKQIHLVDSVCINLGKVDSQTLYNEIAKLRTAAANTDDYTRLNLGRAILSLKTYRGYELETTVVNGEKIIKEAMRMNAPEIAAMQYMALGSYYELKKQNLGKAFENYLQAYNLPTIWELPQLLLFPGLLLIYTK